MKTDQAHALCESRSDTIDYDRVSTLHYLGNYTRKIPVSITRMMENTYDWEHLPFVHASSFGSIELLANGAWGWRAKAEAAPKGSDDYMVIELLVDTEKNYWATTTIAGTGAGTQIHTQATSLDKDEIEIDVRFYLEDAPDKQEDADFARSILTELYARLYDEDTELMSGRQLGLDRKRQRRERPIEASTGAEILVGDIADFNRDGASAAVTDTAQGRFCVRYWRGEWIAHSADCPHLLGPLEEANMAEDGSITCPWHGYRFDATSGTLLFGGTAGHSCLSLATSPPLVERDGKLYLREL